VRLAIPLLVLGLVLPLRAEEAKKSKTHTVDSGALQVTAEATGPLTAAQKAEIRLKPETYAGALSAVEVVPSGTRVKKGQLLLRSDRKKYDEAVKDAKEALDDAEKEYAFEKIEAELAEKKEAMAYERAQLDNDVAQHDLDLWVKYRCQSALRNSELGTMRQQNGLDDESQELAQLEEMYKKSELATETKEIVLERARRNIAINKEEMEMTKKEGEFYKTIEHPDQDHKTRLDAQHRFADFEMSKVAQAEEAEKRKHALDKAERGLKKSREEYDKLIKDAVLLEVVSPADGILSHEEMKKGDDVTTNKVIMEVWTPDKYEIELSAAEADVVAISVGAHAEVVVAAAPGAQLKGMITEASLVGKGDDPAKYPFKLSIDGASPELRFGMHAKVTILGPELKDVLWVPRAAVTTKDGKTTVKVKKGEEEEIRTVGLGLGNADNVQVVKGLAKGDIVTWDEE